MRLPLGKRLKKRLHREVALLQDELVDASYSVDNELVLHGGTAVWRCFHGNRFSEDLDFYCKNPERFGEEFPKTVRQRGLELKKFKKTDNVFFAKVSNQHVEVRVEANFTVKKRGVSTPFERIDGSFTQVLCLTPKQLILEKMGAYESRRLIRDVFDVLQLSNYADDAEVKVKAKKFLEGIASPVDEPNLKAITYSGNVPTFKQIVDALRRRFA